MENASRLYFIALLPPADIQEEVTQIKRDFADNYGSRAALKSPPHVTLQPPFERSIDEVSRLKACLREFATGYAPVPMKLSGFGAFPPRVIYVDVMKTPELMAIQASLAAHLEANLGWVDPRNRSRPFAPHMTVAFRDLKREAFKKAWSQYRDRSISYEFTATHLTLLHHNSRCWEIETEFPFFRGLERTRH
ncbi:MAG TPA: 2'-5' RNA ligase family protein [Oscillatoriales cyanobacterium M4454_W2019_049]|nr:2'-5' RNA ligase family protein [Oscillatoriales cyanobacterium M4454_W2019_049]